MMQLRKTGVLAQQEHIKDVSCPSCQRKELRLVGRIPDANYFAGRVLDRVLPGGKLWECSNCAFLFRWPRLDDADITSLYEQGKAGAWQCDASKRHDWKIAAKWIREGIPEGGKVLDVGCSTGQFLAELLGGEYAKFGIEINDGAADKARSEGVTIVASDLDGFSSPSDHGLFDVVTAFDVIEHVANPSSFISKLAAHVRPGGRLLISTGNTETWPWRLMGATYCYCVNPEHISFLSPTWCQTISAKKEVSVQRTESFSHSAKGWGSRIRQGTANFSYRFFRPFFRYARQAGIGKIDVRRFPTLAEHPVGWDSERDHFIAEFVVSNRKAEYG